jgi:hypothetical protein
MKCCPSQPKKAGSGLLCTCIEEKAAFMESQVDFGWLWTFVGSKKKNNFKSTTKQTLRSAAKESLISGSLHVFIFQSHYPNNPKKIPSSKHGK